MSRVACSKCEIRFTSDLLTTCLYCQQSFCRNCLSEHAAKHKESASQKVPKPTESSWTEDLKKSTPKEKKREEDDRGSLSDA